MSGWQACAPFFPLTGTVRAFKGSTAVATANVGKNGDFVLLLEPGTYRLVGTGARYLGSGTDCGPTVVDVRANRTISVKVLCEMASIR
jgi:hypothetical protein